MDMPINRLKQSLRAGQPQIGLWSSLASYITVEIVAAAGSRTSGGAPADSRRNAYDAATRQCTPGLPCCSIPSTPLPST